MADQAPGDGSMPASTIRPSDDLDNVGLRLRMIRTRHGLSQRALAKKAAVPSSSVSLIESGQVNPSVGVLKRLLDAIGQSLADLFSIDLPAEEKVFFAHKDLVPISKGRVSYRQVGSNLRQRSLQMLYETYQPGADSGRVPLSHDGEEGGIVVDGCLEVTVGSQRRVLKPGEAYFFSSTIPHRFRNTGDKPCVVVSACTPPSF